ncbi:HD domain-containing phosphohydrolase, partial [Klebsiella pneumoniae]|uniref:HD domain-containing phosphohydrolase n=1 Tax=Klebsiella pneumoniae TaxID=573 RepID=UPI001D41F966|nr:hypothetical protein [Klebsiella pneumoniae]
FDALTTERPYKKAWTVEAALEVLHKDAGKHFDPKLVTLFVQVLPQILEIKERWAEHTRAKVVEDPISDESAAGG